MSEKAIFFDRDGVLNKPKVIQGKPFAPTKLRDFVIYADAYKVVKNFKKHLYKIIVVTNQKDVGKGIIRYSLEKMHNKLKEMLPIDEIKVCICLDDCECYKPNPGMLLDAKKKMEFRLEKMFYYR